MQQKIIVFPVYNEEYRIKKSCFIEFIEHNPDFQFVFVDDGSADNSLSILQEIQSRASDRVQIKKLEKNSGKAEAVRQGLLFALGMNPAILGYGDADLSTSLDELRRLADKLNSSGCKVLLGSRVKLLGKRIERKMLRHYFGRIFATLASIVLNLGVYDTQCGAKFFKCHNELHKVLKKPFVSRWVFDIEIMKRLLKTQGMQVNDFVEEPLNEWITVAGSKLGLLSMVKAVYDLLKIGLFS